MDGTDQIYAGPDGTALRFFERPTKNNFQSEKNGRPIFDTSLIVEVMVPGSRESTPEFELLRTYCEEAGSDAQGNRLVGRSPKYVQYEAQVNAYLAQNGSGLTKGTPISQWPNVDAGTAATLKAAGIYTVEMLAGVQDTHLPNLGIGGRVLRDQASAYLQTQQFGVPSAQMAADSANLKDENTRLRADNTDLTARLSAALAEVNSLRTGNVPQQTSGTQSGAPGNALNDPLGTNTISQPNPFGQPSALTPTEGQTEPGKSAPTPDADPKADGFQYNQASPPPLI